MEVAEKVRSIIVEQLGVEENEVKEASAFIDDLGADSLDTVELVMALEEEFNIEIAGLGNSLLTGYRGDTQQFNFEVEPAQHFLGVEGLGQAAHLDLGGLAAHDVPKKNAVMT